MGAPFIFAERREGKEGSRLNRVLAPSVLPFAVVPHKAIREIDGFRYLVSVWTYSQWDRVAEQDRPRTAQRIGELGWMDIQLEPGSL